MGQQIEQTAIEVIGAAGRGEATWGDVSREVVKVVGADAASIVVWRTSDHAVLAFEGAGIEPMLEQEYSEHYYQYDLLLKNPPPSGSWVVSDERFPEARQGRGPFFGDFLWRHRVRQILALSLNLGADVTVALAVHRRTPLPARSSDFLEGSLGRVSRAAGMAFSNRYGIAQAVRASLFEAYSMGGDYSFLADPNGRVYPLIPGEPLRDLLPLAFRNGLLRHPDSRIEQRLRKLIAATVAGTRGSMRFLGRDGRAMRVEMLPLPRHGKVSSNELVVLVSVRQANTREVPEIDDLREVFGITYAQAIVLRLLCESYDAKECAEKTNCSIATVRNHIAQLMMRMNCTRQAQLIHMARQLLA